jgi:dTDP-4-amino-4,6-dideoxygalactose transaminase
MKPGRKSDFLPFSRPTIEEDEIAEVVDSLRSGWLTTVSGANHAFCDYSIGGWHIINTTMG